MISTNETDFPLKCLLSDEQVSSHSKAFLKKLSVNIKSLKTQLPEIIKAGEFLDRILKTFKKVILLLISCFTT